MLSLIARSALALGFAVALAIPASGQDTRTVETEFGSVEVPVNPTRIVTTFHGSTQSLLDLGIAPVGRGPVSQVATTPEQWALIGDVPTVTLDSGEVNYEFIATLEPDLIFESSGSSEDRIERLRQIAPVVLLNFFGPERGNWQGRVRQVAEILDRVEIADALEAEFVARQAQIAEDYAAVIAHNTIGVIGVFVYDQPVLHHSTSLVGHILEPTGAVFGEAGESFAREAIARDNSYDVLLSLEDIGQVYSDVDVLFLNSTLAGEPANDDNTRFRSAEVFLRLPAVENGRVFPIGSMTPGSYAVANTTLDHYVAALEALAAQEGQ